MRQDLWSENASETSQIQPRALHQQAQQILRPSPQPSIAHSEVIFKHVKSEIINTIGRDPFTVVIGVPIYFRTDQRRQLRAFVSQHLDDMDVHILATVRQPALATTTFHFHVGESKSKEFALLNVDYNHASLDITLAVTQMGMTDIVEHTSLPLLGEDSLNLNLASLSYDDADKVPSDRRALRSRAEQVKRRRIASSSNASANITDTSIVESTFFGAIANSLESFLGQHTHAAGYAPRRDEEWKPHVDELSHILVAGDASSRGFQGLRKAIATHGGVLAGLLDPGIEPGAPSTAWVSADGAARSARSRRHKDESGQWNWIVHTEL
ncbi:MAG: hypothetical protein L6R39_001681 [Caloplaca ligustica]|nr:MAG: hypothetical protein L6R39_001681 [Caloplaca ligustica]